MRPGARAVPCCGMNGTLADANCAPLCPRCAPQRRDAEAAALEADYSQLLQRSRENEREHSSQVGRPGWGGLYCKVDTTQQFYSLDQPGIRAIGEFVPGCDYTIDQYAIRCSAYRSVPAACPAREAVRGVPHCSASPPPPEPHRALLP